MNSRDIKRFKAIWLRMMSLFGGIVLFGQMAWAQAPLPPVSIGVSQSNVAGGVRYQYQVINHGSFPVTSVVIGLNYYYSERPELRTPPVGWSVANGIPSSSVSSPNGWTARITPTEDTDLLQLEWVASTPSYAMAPGQTQGFSILVPQSDATYVSSDWTVYVDGAGTNYYTSTLALQPLPAEAKSNLSPDPGTGTGGITITGVTNTMGGEETGKFYDDGTRKVAKMPPEWFTCKTSDDCGLVPVPCNTSFAVSKAHKDEAQAAYCKAMANCGAGASCLASLPDTSLAVCDNGQCRTVIRGHNPGNAN